MGHAVARHQRKIPGPSVVNKHKPIPPNPNIVEEELMSDDATQMADESITASNPDDGQFTLVTYTYCVGGIFYAFLCGPAIGRRGYPPIDPAWMAVTFLWVVPILLSAAIDTRPFRQRFRGLALYCIATAFFDAATFGGTVPRYVTFLGTLFDTVTLFGPLHLVVGAILDGFIQLIRSIARLTVSTQSPIVRSVTPWLVFAVLLVLAGAFPFVFRASSFAELAHRGRTQAEKDWDDHRAVLYIDWLDSFEYARDPTIINEYDRTTGLKQSHPHRETQYVEAYNERIAGLLREHGIPDWSMKDHLVDASDLIGMLDSAEMAPIEQFPYEINENIILFRRGTIRRWGGTMSSSNDSLSIGTKASLVGVGNDKKPVSVGRLVKYPEVVFIRNGDDWVGAFHESGRQLSSASRR